MKRARNINYVFLKVYSWGVSGIFSCLPAIFKSLYKIEHKTKKDSIILRGRKTFLTDTCAHCASIMLTCRQTKHKRDYIFLLQENVAS